MEGEDDFIVGMAFGAVIVVVIVLLGWALTGGLVKPLATTDNCPVEYKTK